MKVIVNGAAGRMGGTLLRLVSEGFEGAELFAACDKSAKNGTMFASLSDIPDKADVIVDFSFHTGTGELLGYAVEKRIPTVIATTGQTCDEIEMIRKAADYIPVFFSRNMSVGVAVLIRLAEQAASAFPDADIEIVETHHNRKADAPSGTALMIAEGIRNVRPDSVNNCGRRGNERRSPNEIGISSVRRGNINGIHEVYISTDTQTITLRHEAHDRALFAEGALTAAKFISTAAAGLYDMESILNSSNDKRNNI